MPISSVVITLSSDAPLSRSTLDTLRAHGCIEIGVVEGRRAAAVIETPDSERDKAVWHWLNALPGVEFVDVTFVHFDDRPGARSESGSVWRDPVEEV